MTVEEEIRELNWMYYLEHFWDIHQQRGKGYETENRDIDTSARIRRLAD